jgi:hypothetical protein
MDKWLLAVSAGSNEITLFKINGTNLTFANKTSSHGLTPISLIAAFAMSALHVLF